LELAFDSKQLRNICERESSAIEELGADIASVLKRRLADLRAARSPRELPLGNLRLENGEKGKVFVIDVCEGVQLVFCSNHVKPLLTVDGDVDVPRIGRIKILEIRRSQ
jgi:plasmid maintenance system killer protein